MAIITVRDVPEDVYREIKHIAKEENRSLNRQCLHIFQQYMKHKRPVGEIIKRIEALHERVGPVNFSPEEIKAMIEEGRP